MIFDVDVVVVGAGPAGLLLAGDLARAGVSCAVFERRAERSGLTRAFAVHARTLEQLDARGIADELVATGTPVPELRFFADAALDLSRLPSRFGYGPGRWALTSITARRSPGSPSTQTAWRWRSARTLCTTRGGCHGSTATNGRCPATGTAASSEAGLRTACWTPTTPNGIRSGVVSCAAAARCCGSGSPARPLSSPPATCWPTSPPGPLTWPTAWRARYRGSASPTRHPAAPIRDVTAGYQDRVETITVARSSSTTALIRPDAYIAWAAAGEAASAPRVRDSLASWCGSPALPRVQGARV